MKKLRVARHSTRVLRWERPRSVDHERERCAWIWRVDLLHLHLDLPVIPEVIDVGEAGSLGGQHAMQPKEGLILDGDDFPGAGCP